MPAEHPITFKLPRSVARAQQKVLRPRSLVPPVPVNPRTEINGYPVGSSYEANVADALDALGWRYYYQYSVHGGRQRRGGIVLDFLVQTRPAPTPVYVNGRYWHSKRTEADRLQQANLSSYFSYPVRDSLVMWDEDCLTVELAYNFLMAKIGRY